MSNRKAVIFPLIILLSLLFGGSYFYVKSEQRQTLGLRKFLRQKPSFEKLRMTAKLQVPTLIEFKILEDSVSPGETFTLTAVITPNSHVPAADITWMLPAGIEIVSGEKTQFLGDLQVDQSLEISLRLFHKSLENQNIQLLIGSKSDGGRIQSLATMSTLNHKSNIIAAKKLHELNENYIADHPELLKIRK